ncbi:MAG: signal peptidase I [Micrococcaceae bacterium]
MTEKIDLEEQYETRKSKRKKEEATGLWGFIKDFVPTLIVAFAVMSLITHFLVRPFMIPSGSMEQTLNINDRILVDKLHSGQSHLQRGDVVVFKRPDGWVEETQENRNPVKDSLKTVGSWIGVTTAPGESFLVKRIIGMPGDHVKTDGTTVTVNGKALSEPYLFPGNDGSDVPFDVTVPQGQIWVMGDHRSNSADSRYHMNDPSKGFVPISDVQGKAFFKMYPFTKMGSVSDQQQTFSGIPAASSS